MSGRPDIESEIAKLARENPEEARKVIRRMLREENGCMSQVAKKLGLGRVRLWRALDRLGMRGEPARAAEETKRRFRLTDPA